MITPARYTGKVFFEGVQPNQVLPQLDPQLWSTRAGQIWSQSYLIEPPALAAQQGAPPGSVPPDAPRANDPRQAPTQIHWAFPGFFFEDVTTLGFRYRNILVTQFVNQGFVGNPHPFPPRGPPPDIRFDYLQYECLNTGAAAGDEEGGIDTDNGFTECRALNGGVEVTISKNVRFTHPSALEPEINAIAHILVPLILDTWLHNMTF